MKFADSFIELAGVVVVIVAAAYGLIEYREHKAGVQVEQMERLHDSFSSPEMGATRARAASQPGKFGRDAHDVLNFLEKVARWEEKGIINVEDLDYYFHDAFLLYWYGWEEAIKAHRRSQNAADLYEGVERVVARIEKDLGAQPPASVQIDQLLSFERSLGPTLEESATPAGQQNEADPLQVPQGPRGSG